MNYQLQRILKNSRVNLKIYQRFNEKIMYKCWLSIFCHPILINDIVSIIRLMLFKLESVRHIIPPTKEFFNEHKSWYNIDGHPCECVTDIQGFLYTGYYGCFYKLPIHTELGIDVNGEIVGIMYRQNEFRIFLKAQDSCINEHFKFIYTEKPIKVIEYDDYKVLIFDTIVNFTYQPYS